VVHEAAGHAPIIADPDYSDYLRAFGGISRQAIYSGQDMALFRAIRHLSEVKEDPAATPAAMDAAQRRFEETAAALDWVSESNELSRLYWWTVEYGLIGPLEDPRIYGAGLLSSAGESWHCLGPRVKRLPLDVGCVQVAFDITRQQPQLFVTPDFPHLRSVLEEYAATMACRTGGRAALEKALHAKAPTTTRLDSGLQVSGVLQEVLTDGESRLGYLRWGGPVLLAEDDQPLRGHGRETHVHGFGAAVGRLAGGRRCVGELGAEDLRQLGFGGGGRGRLEYASGLVLEGRIGELRETGEHNQLIRFEDCRVTWGDRLLFDPAWGSYDLVCGTEAVSVSGGWVDRGVEPEDLPAGPAAMKCNLDDANRDLANLYAEVRRVRESDERGAHIERRLGRVAERLERDHPADWLLRLELVELEDRLPAELGPVLRERLARLEAAGPEAGELIGRGLALCS
jgi:phenylalanine-4-hydroxylase